MTLTTSTRGWTRLQSRQNAGWKGCWGTYQTPSLWCCTGRQLLHSLRVLPHSSLLSSLGWPCVHPQPTQLEKMEWDVDDLVTDSRVTWCAEVLMGDSSWSAVQLRTAVRQLPWRAARCAAPVCPRLCWEAHPDTRAIQILVEICPRPVWSVKVWAFSRKRFWAFLKEMIPSVGADTGN